MEPDARYAWVGACVLILLALLTGAILWLIASGQHRDDRSYRIYFARQSLEGLQVRSDVRMRGIRVGGVSGFAFSSTRPGTVEVTIGLDPATPVRQSTQAVVERNLITGLASIRLVNAKEDSPLLKVAPPGEDYPIIAEGASQLQQVADSLNQLVVRADETMRRIDDTLSDSNLAAFAETLSNLRLVSRNAVGASTRLDSTLASVGRAADEVRSQSVILGADAHGLAGRYDALGAQTGTAVRDIAGSVKQLSADVSQLSGRIDGVLVDSDMQLRFTARGVRASAGSVGQAARRLGDPRAALFGPSPESLGPGEESR